MPSGREIVTAALSEIGVTSQGETLSAADAIYALSLANRVLDNWNADKRAVYADQPIPLTLTASLNPHTIGPDGATWPVDSRPVTIEAITIEIDDLRYGLKKRDAQWYRELSDPETSGQPTDFWYDPAWDNGNVYLYPVPDSALSIHLYTRMVLTALVLDIDVTFPPGYLDALILTTAEAASEAYGKQMPPTLPARALKSRARVFANNVTAPKLCTRDSGMPSGTGSTWDYRTGQ